MDPRAKVFGLILLMVAVFMSYPSWEMTAVMAGIAFLVIAVLLFASHLSLRQLFRIAQEPLAHGDLPFDYLHRDASDVLKLRHRLQNLRLSDLLGFLRRSGQNPRST
jgi:hypothetical protein